MVRAALPGTGSDGQGCQQSQQEGVDDDFRPPTAAARSWPGDGRGIDGVVEDRERGASGVAGGLQGYPKSPAPPAFRVARQIEVMLERDIWVRPGKDDVS